MLLKAGRPCSPWLLVLALAGGCLPPIAAPGGVPPAVARADSLAREAIRNERGIDPLTFPERSVGVVPLTVVSTDTSLLPLGWGLADLLTTDLARSGELQVVERVRIDALIRELGLAAAGVVDSSRAPQLGRLMGARQLVTGVVVQAPGDRLEVSTRLAEVVDGRITGMESTTLDLDRILDVQKDLAFSLLDRLGVNLTPAERAAIEQRPTRSITALLAYSRGVRDEARGDFRAAAGQYREAVRLDPSFGQAQARLERAEAVVQDAPMPVASPVTASDQMKRTMELAADPLSLVGVPIRSDATDPGFSTSARQLVTLIIRLTIP